MKSILPPVFCLLLTISLHAQRWNNVDSAYAPLPASVHIYFTSQAIDTAPFRAFYIEADLNDRNLDFTVDTTLHRRLTPSAFYEKNQHPLLVVNASFFSFATNQNLNMVVMRGKLAGYNVHSLPGKGRDTLTYRHPYGSAIGISRNRKADIGWCLTDSSLRKPYLSESVLKFYKDSVENPGWKELKSKAGAEAHFSKWKVETAIGGGPVLLQNGEIAVSNNEELKFGGKAISDKHPRTAMGYTANGKLIILMVEGRNAIAHGASLTQEAELLKELGCVEAINLDGGGSSCLLLNGKPTITVSDKEGQRPVPAVFMISNR